MKGVARINLPGVTSAAITPAGSSTALGDLVRERHVLHSGDIVVPRISKQEAWVFKEDGHTWVPSGHVAVLRPVSGEYDSDFIAACLNAPVNIDTRGMVPRRVPLLRAVIADLNPEQRAIAAELSRSLAEARESARELERETLETSDAFLNLMFAN